MDNKTVTEKKYEVVKKEEKVRDNKTTEKKYEKKLESVPEYVVEISKKTGEKIYTFKMRGKDELEHVPFRNLTESMRKMLIDFYENLFLSTLGLPVSSEVVTSDNDSVHNLEILAAKQEKKCIEDFKK